MAIAGAITPITSSPLLNFVESRSGQKVLTCYQCGKCSAGCPAAYAMDLTPRQVMRAIQLGLKDEVFESSTIWLCLFCQTCTARCPCEIDLAKVMESLRLLASAEKTKPTEKEVELFHRLFLKLVRRGGRIYEVGLAGLYNLFSRHLLANVSLLPAMLCKGKLSIMPPRAKGAKEVRAIFAKVEEIESEKGSR